MFVCKVRTQLVAWLSALYNCSEEDETRAQRSEFIRDYNYNSKPTKLDEGPAAESHRRRPTTSTVAACERRLDFLTAFRSPVTVARNSDCAFNTVLGPPHSAGRPCMDHGRTRLAWRSRRARALATELTELATELTMWRSGAQPPHQDGHPALGAALRHLQDQAAPRGRGCSSRHPTAARLQQAPHSSSTHPTAAGTCRPLLPLTSVPCTTALLSQLLLAQANVDFKLPIHNFAAGDPALEYI